MARIGFILTLVAFLSTQVAVAQKTKQKLLTYSGPYGEGKATFAYSEDPTTGEKIKQGAFLYNASKGLLTITTQGSYLNGKKDGKWMYTETGSGYLTTSTFTSAASMTTGSYRDSFPIGQWNIVDTGYVREGQTEMVSSARGSAMFVPTGWKSGHTQLSGDFSYAETNSDGYSSISVTGRFASKGYMDGRWTIIYYFEGEYNEEVREYEDGFLLSVTVRGVTSGKLYVRLRNDSTIARLERIRRIGDSADYRIKNDSPPRLWWKEAAANGVLSLDTGDKVIQKAKERFGSDESKIGGYCLAFYIRGLEPNTSQ